MCLQCLQSFEQLSRLRVLGLPVGVVSELRPAFTDNCVGQQLAISKRDNSVVSRSATGLLRDGVEDAEADGLANAQLADVVAGLERARLIVVQAGSIDEGQTESAFLSVLVLENQSVAGEDALDFRFHWCRHVDNIDVGGDLEGGVMRRK